MPMLTLFAALLAASAPDAPSAEASNPDWQCATGRNRLQGQESRETWDAIKEMKKDGAAGVPKEAQALLDQLTDMYEKDDSRHSSDTAEMMREFAGGKAERRTKC